MLESQKEEIRGRLVVQSNSLIRKNREMMTLQENKILLYLISNIKPTDETVDSIVIDLRELCDICGIELNGKNYYNLRESLKSLASKHFWMARGTKEVLCAWIVKPEIDRESQTVEVRFDPDTLPFLVQLRREFTTYELRFALACHSTYGLRLYELLKSYASVGTWTVDLESFRDLTNSQNYKDFVSLRRRVIEPALREIEIKTDLSVTYEALREYGKRAVSAISFTIKRRHLPLARFAADLALDNPNDEIFKKKEN